MKVDNYNKAYREVWEILKYMPKEDVEKIPTEFIYMIEENMDKNYNYNIDENKSFAEQEMMMETREILAIIYKDYWATEEKRNIINNEIRKAVMLENENKKKIYDVNDLFKNKKDG